MVDTGTNAIARLKKTHAERLLADYDSEPVAALSVALRVVLEMPNANWAELVAATPFNATRRERLVERDEASLDQLAAELNEFRDLTG